MKRNAVIAAVVTVAAWCAVCTSVMAQGAGIEIGGGFLVGVPQGEFRNNIEDAGLGFGVNIGLAPAGAPLMIGLEGGFMTYGNETRNEPLSTTIPDVTVKVENSNNIVIGQLYARLQPQTGFFRPYTQGFIGFNYLFTETTVSNQFEEDNVFSSTNFDDGAFAYGVGGGLAFVLANTDMDGEGNGDIMLDIRGMYSWGGEAEYLKEGSIKREGGNVTYDTQRSATDMLLIRVGVSFRFGE